MQRKELKLSSAVSANSAVKKKNMEMKKSTRYEMRDTRYENGSALILVVVLTSLLAIVGVMFVMVARVDRIATSAISENKTLDSAVETVIARISQELVLDVPRLGQEYYDYPDAKNAWLASLEPHKDGGYKWRQISDVYNKLGLSLELDADIIPDYQKPSDVGDSNSVTDYPADADGDGVADSKWVELDDITSNKGKPIFAAVRVIDNGGMLNVNTAYKFDPNDPGVTIDDIDGSSQMQINLMAFSWGRYHTTYNSSAETDLLEARANNGSSGLDPQDLDEYEKNVIWRYNEPNGAYTPFDISDEIELRYRFLINHKDIDTRLEELGVTQGWSWEFRTIYDFRTPAETGDLGEWFISSYDDGSFDPNYAYRHIATTYNMDRIINPYGGRMFNINMATAANKDIVHGMIAGALIGDDFNSVDVNNVSASAAQIAVNLIDFRDNDSNVTDYTNPDDGKTYYGFERPCVYISEVVHKFVIPPAPGGPIGPGGEPVIYRSYAIELYKPYEEDSDPDNWQLVISGPPPPGGPIGAPVGRFLKGECDIDWSSGEQFHVMLKEDSGAPLPPIDDSNAGVQDCGALIFGEDDLIELQRRVDEDSDIWVTVDSIEVTGWLVPDPPVVGTRSFKRDINRHKCIRRLWGSDADEEDLTLGLDNSYIDPSSRMIQAHPENSPFTNIGEIGMVFRKGAYYIDPADRPDTIGYSTNTDDEAEVRLDLADPNYRNLFQYLTVFDPTRDGINNDGDEYSSGAEIIDETELYLTPELKIPGRININTAPWYVIAQLPWMKPEIARAIVAYRDKLDDPVDYTNRYNAIRSKIDPRLSSKDIREDLGFESIGELNFVIYDVNDEYSMRYYILGDEENDDLAGFPDLTTLPTGGDGAADDFEERDVIFSRLSNLVTVRSDVFTTYILVRIGADGPQKRVMAILDRSNVYPPEGGKVRIVALYPVADPDK